MATREIYYSDSTWRDLCDQVLNAPTLHRPPFFINSNNKEPFIAEILAPVFCCVFFLQTGLYKLLFEITILTYEPVTCFLFSDIFSADWPHKFTENVKIEITLQREKIPS